MIKKDIKNKSLPGCYHCLKAKCGFYGSVASPTSPAFNKGIISYYGCNSYRIETGKKWHLVAER